VICAWGVLLFTAECNKRVRSGLEFFLRAARKQFCGYSLCCGDFRLRGPQFELGCALLGGIKSVLSLLGFGLVRFLDLGELFGLGLEVVVIGGKVLALRQLHPRIATQKEALSDGGFFVFNNLWLSFIYLFRL